MAKEKVLKRVEIKNGKFCLEGRIVNAKIIGLSSLIHHDFETYNLFFENFDNARCAEMEKRNEQRELEFIEKMRPDEANAYVKGDRNTINENHPSERLRIYPVLYLRIKNNIKLKC